MRLLHGLAEASCSSFNQIGDTPAHCAAEEGHVECLRALCELGVSLVADKHGWTPAHSAADQLECLRLLHEIGASASLSTTDEDGNTPAHVAARGGHVECVRLLHELAEASCSTFNKEGDMPAHCAAEGGHVECLRVLHELGVGLIANENGRTPAHAAAGSGQIKCLWLLRELGADLSAVDKKGCTPAKHAADTAEEQRRRAAINHHSAYYLEQAQRRDACAEFLTEAAADEVGSAAEKCRAVADAALAEAVASQDVDTIREALKTHDRLASEARVKDARKAREKLECLRVLHELGVGLIANENGRTPAHAAAGSGQIECLQLLHELGAEASLSAADGGGNTPAHIVGLEGHVECVEFLTEAAADEVSSAAEKCRAVADAALAEAVASQDVDTIREALKTHDRLASEARVKDARKAREKLKGKAKKAEKQQRKAAEAQASQQAEEARLQVVEAAQVPDLQECDLPRFANAMWSI